MDKRPPDSWLAEYSIHKTVAILIKHDGRNRENGINQKFFHDIPPANRVCYSALFILE
jgi:hypothetical protein